MFIPAEEIITHTYLPNEQLPSDYCPITMVIPISLPELTLPPSICPDSNREVEFLASVNLSISQIHVPGTSSANNIESVSTQLHNIFHNAWG